MCMRKDGTYLNGREFKRHVLPQGPACEREGRDDQEGDLGRATDRNAHRQLHPVLGRDRDCGPGHMREKASGKITT